MCTSCRDVAVALGRPLLPVTPIALVTRSSPLYRALRQYKSGEPDVASRQNARLVSLLDRFFTRHAGCVVPGGLDACVVVPSPLGGRPPPHPLTTLVAGSASLPKFVDALFPGTSPVAHRQPSAHGYRATVRVWGKRVLLVDDVYTSGAHLQSAALALEAAGARTVGAVVLGRIVSDEAPRLRCARCQP
jgi:phosphoribosylpyrophosphate synthetase